VKISHPKILIIGIDGATFELIRPWVDKGELPAIAKLLRGGVSADLRSTVPPLTAPAWTSFMTGKNPGKHGLFHFIEPQQNSYQMQYTNARSRKVRTVWSQLNEAGKTVGVLNVPMTYPPEAVERYMISGMDTPDDKSEFVHPAALKEELLSVFGKIRLDIRHLGYMQTDEIRDLVLKEWETLEEDRARIARYLMGKYPSDVVMVVFNSVDQVQHHFWHYMDPAHPWYDAAGAEKYRDAILNIYRKTDEQVGVLLDSVPEDAVVMMVSDHGAGAISQRALFLNRYLYRIGLLKYKDQDGGSGMLGRLIGMIGSLDAVLRKNLTPGQKAKLAKLLPGLRQKWESYHTAYAAIDWKATKAFAYEALSFCPNVWINLKGKWPDGTVEPGTDYEETVAYLIRKLYELPDPRTGKPAIRKVYRREEIYSGPYARLAPDITLPWWDESGFFLRQSGISRGNEPVIAYVDTPNFGVDWSGTHRFNGILIMSGGPFKKGERLEHADILDIAPTLLHLAGLPVPSDMDGKVLVDGFNPEYLRDRPVTFRKSESEGPAEEKESTYSDEEAALVEKRLQDMGYIE
jgi:predicted AlkP superfamily phosphohydrolase/phosphomutase